MDFLYSILWSLLKSFEKKGKQTFPDTLKFLAIRFFYQRHNNQDLMVKNILEHHQISFSMKFLYQAYCWLFFWGGVVQFQSLLTFKV